MTSTEALKQNDFLEIRSSRTYTFGNRTKYMYFDPKIGKWVVGEKMMQLLLETESEEEAVAKLLEEDDAGL